MPATVVIGGQWGDEGKGRVVDFFARDCAVVARYSAGNNAGHTIVNERGRFALHLVPAGIFYEDKTCVMGKPILPRPMKPIVLYADIRVPSVLEKLITDTLDGMAEIVEDVYYSLCGRLDTLEHLRDKLGTSRLGRIGRGGQAQLRAKHPRRIETWMQP